MSKKSESLVNLTTYHAGLLQATAFRKLNQFVNSILDNHNLTHSEWLLLGIIRDRKNIGTMKLSVILDVEPPFVTNISNGLEKRGLLLKKNDLHDRRLKRINLTPRGERLIIKVEKNLREEMKKYLAGISTRELVVYTNVLKKIANL